MSTTTRQPGQARADAESGPQSRQDAFLGARAVLDGKLSEAQFQASVVALAQILGWLVFHPYDSRRSQRGFPDLTLCRPPRVVFAELKTERGRLSPDQRRYQEILAQCPNVEVYLWKPSDWSEIERALTEGR